jgi:hypothetical protein
VPLWPRARKATVGRMVLVCCGTGREGWEGLGLSSRRCVFAALCMLCSGSAVRARKPGDWCLADRKAPLCSTRGLSWFDSNSTSHAQCTPAAPLSLPVCVFSHLVSQLGWVGGGGLSSGDYFWQGWVPCLCGSTLRALVEGANSSPGRL